MTQLTLLTIITEDVLAQVIEREIEQLGAKGFTLSSVTGKSLGHTRDNPWEGENVKIETIVTEEISQKILKHLQEKYFDRFAMIAFTHPVQVVRSDHF
jgi:nitrogen regulatory protein PII-like uncharacterized protein